MFKATLSQAFWYENYSLLTITSRVLLKLHRIYMQPENAIAGFALP